ncbi:MAG TPA: MFS transporter [Caulobacteraceae bacterium]|nr:MFS transporter [Caulobacteraceae bacterium]
MTAGGGTEAPAAKARPAALAFIAVTVVLDNLAMWMIMPVLPRLLGTLQHGGAGRTALFYGAFLTVFAVMQFVAAPIQGALSDRFGRRPIVLASNLGLGLDYVVMALAPTVWWLFAGRLISGVAAGSGPAASAYLADVTPPEKRAASFGLIMAAQAVGAAIGPALGGLVSAIDLRAPFWASAALSLANLAYGAFVLPESLPKSARAPLKFTHLNPLGALVWLLRAHPRLAALVVVAFLLSFASQGANGVVVLYATDRYRWTPAAIGILMTAFAVMTLVVQGGLVSIAAKRFGELGSMLGGLGLNVAGLAAFAFATRGWQFAALMPVVAVGSIAAPMMGSIFSKAVAADEQGRLQGAWSSVNGLMGFVAPAAFTAIFARSLGFGAAWSGAAFVFAAALIALSIPIAARAPKAG